MTCLWRKPHIETVRDWRERGFPRRIWKCTFPDLPVAKGGVGITPAIAWTQLFMINGLHHPLLYPGWRK